MEKLTTRRSCRKTKSNEGSPYIDGKRKRKNSVPPVGKPKMPNKQKIDEYCFICHQLVQDLTCRACSRAYHTKCVKKKHIQFNTEDSCGECQAQLLNGGISIPGLDLFSFSELLEMVLEEALKDGVKKNNQKSQSQAKEENIYFKYFTVFEENSSLCQTMDLSILVDNIKRKYFLSTAEFFSHAKWLYHNSYILYGVHSEFTQTALKLEKNIRKELLDLEACAQCYYNKHKQDHRANFFTRICKESHDIVWAKLRGSPYWPAKCMRISNGHADVTFFGTHDRSSIPLAQCYRISEISPNDKSIKQSKYHDAIEELEIYLDNYRTNFGTFPYFPLRTPLIQLNIVTPKKPNKRGRHRRSPSSKQNDSFASEVNTPSAENMEPFKDIQTKLDASSEADSCLSLNNCEMKSSKLPTKRSCEPEPVSVSMTFTEDEAVSYNHISTPSAHINVSQVDSSVSREYPTPVTNWSPMLVETPDFLPSTGTTLQNGSKHFINSGSSNVPVIASVSTDDSTFSNELPETSEGLHFSNPMKNHANIPNSLKDTWSQQSQDMNTSDYEDDDDEVQVINHVPPKLSKSLKSIVNSPAMVQTFCQVLFSNKPQLQGLYNECLKLGHKAFIEFWLATVVEKHGESQVALFAKAFDKVIKEKEALETEKKDCMKDLQLYRRSYALHQELYDQLHKDHKLLQKNYATINEERNNAAKVALFIRDDDKPKNSKLQELQKVHDSNLEKNKELQDQLDETKINLSKKEEELEKYMDKVLQLEDKLKSLEKPSCANSECQTLTCDLSENQLYTAHHFEEFKQALQGQSCSKHNSTKDDVIEKIEFTRQTITKDDYSGDLEVTKETIKKTRTYEFEKEEDQGPPVTPCPQIFAYPQLFANATFSLECAMGPPSTVVSSIHPTSVILNPDYMPQQSSSIVPINNATKRYKNKKRNSSNIK